MKGGVMLRILSLFIFTGMMLIPAASQAEEFVLIECGYTYYTHLHASSELPIVTNYKQRGVIRSKGENKFLDNATYYLEGMLIRPPSMGQYLDFEKGEGEFTIIIIDPEGDMILGYEYGDITLHYLGAESLLKGEFTHGTGKYEGIRGAFELTRFAGEADDMIKDLKRHLWEMPLFGPSGGNDHEMCNLVKGNYEIK